MILLISALIVLLCITAMLKNRISIMFNLSHRQEERLKTISVYLVLILGLTGVGDIIYADVHENPYRYKKKEIIKVKVSSESGTNIVTDKVAKVNLFEEEMSFFDMSNKKRYTLERLVDVNDKQNDRLE